MKGNWLKTAGALLCIFLVSMGCANPSSGGHPNPDKNTLDRIILDDSSDQPISGAVVTLFETGDGNEILGTTTTDASGKFRLDFPSGQDAVDVYITAEGFEDYFADSWSKATWDLRKTLRLTPESTIPTDYTTTVTGVITDEATGAGLEDAAVEAKDTDSDQPVTATTDASGHFTLTIVHNGDFTVSVEAEGYYSETTPIETTQSSIIQNFTMMEQTPGTTFTTTISGYIGDSVTGAGMENVSVFASDEGTENTGTATTDTDGYYSLTLIHDGDFTVEASASGYSDYSTECLTTGSSFTHDIEMSAIPSGSTYTTVISGYLTDSETGEGIEESSVAAALDDTFANLVLAEPDANGYFSLTIEHNGTIHIGSMAADYYFYEKTISTTEAEITQNIELDKIIPGKKFTTTVSGYIIDSETGAAIGNAQITFEDEEATNTITTTSDSNGFYSAEFTHEGLIWLIIEITGYEEIYTGFMTTATAKTKDIYLDPVYETILSGYITDSESGLAIEGAYISIRDPESTFVISILTDSDGYYNTDIDHRGEFSLTASAYGYDEVEFEITTTAETYTQDIQLTPETLYTTTITGYVIDSDTSLGLESIPVRANDPDNWYTYYVETESDGSYSLTITHDGNFELWVDYYGYESYETTITTIESDITQDIILVLNSVEPVYSTTVSGIITDATTGNGIDGAFIELYDSESGNWGITYTDSDGSYSLVIDHSGSFKFTAQAFTYDSYSVNITTGEETYTQNGELSQKDKYTTTFSGVVTDSETGAALTGIEIGAYDNETGVGEFVMTDASGAYSITIEHHGITVVCADSVGFQYQSVYVETTADTYSQHFEMESLTQYTTTISGTVSDSETGEVLSGAYVSVFEYESGTSENVLTDESGNYSIIFSHYGEIEIYASYSGYESSISYIETEETQETRDIDLLKNS